MSNPSVHHEYSSQNNQQECAPPNLSVFQLLSKLQPTAAIDLGHLHPTHSYNENHPSHPEQEINAITHADFGNSFAAIVE